jgi:hypothetical protein
MSHQVVQLIPHSRPTLLAARRILVAAALVATGYLVAVIAPAPLDFFHTVASGSAADAKEHGTPASARSLVRYCRQCVRTLELAEGRSLWIAHS